ncbi:ComEC/Rec2 family competence protein [Segetibacter koreensis]|uniref:ComEC/Rec2 family competence protein n=1 Tax=Segetibacter koreensis TaxID=398037 RepID=UPI0004771111|nr:ComEC/Rec2 family competence protein [Segetibacter koreensis]
MPAYQLYFWKKIPFVRLIIPLIAGILLQFIFAFSPFNLLITAALAVLIIFVFFLLPFAVRFTLRWVPGISINLLLIIIGAFIIYNKDITRKPGWIGNHTTDSVSVLATLQEPLIEKAKTYKALASVEGINSKDGWKNITGNVLIYFSKDGIKSNLKYGSQVLFYKSPQQIKNSGNPGSFNYKQYNAFQNIYHQVFLKSSEYVVTNTTRENAFNKWLLNVRFAVIKKLRQYIQGDREAAVAEALLIGYRNDLDKDLVQAYSNTGVVHIIAISGLHLGMIYGALIFMFRPFKKFSCIKWLKPIFILSVLWVFTALAGGVPSILRSAVMFSFIVLGEAIDRKSSIYNTLAASASVMLCINPYYLWDVGFQLSYAAVISIVTFAKPVYNWFYIKNKILDIFWKLTSVTIAAQILTVPIIFYVFHQFSNLFIITNCIIVPLSSVILFAELALLTTSFMPIAAKLIGFITSSMLAFMNRFIEWVSSFPFAIYDGIQNNLLETFLLYVFIIGICYWLLYKKKQSLFIGLSAILVFVIVDAYENFISRQQQKVIVYNIPQHNAIDFISGKKYAFVGDTTLLHDEYLQNFHLKLSRTLHRIKPLNNLTGLYMSYPFVQFQGKRILLIDKPLKFKSPSKIFLDAIVVSRNPRISISELATVFNCRQFIFDASNSTWKISQWKKDCDSLHLRNYSTPDQGAFELNL